MDISRTDSSSSSNSIVPQKIVWIVVEKKEFRFSQCQSQWITRVIGIYSEFEIARIAIEKERERTVEDWVIYLQYDVQKTRIDSGKIEQCLII